MGKLHVALLESQIRMDNLKAAIQLGLFAQTRVEMVKHLQEFNIAKKPVIDKECEELQLFFKEQKSHD